MPNMGTCLNCLSFLDSRYLPGLLHFSQRGLKRLSGTILMPTTKEYLSTESIRKPCKEIVSLINDFIGMGSSLIKVYWRLHQIPGRAHAFQLFTINLRIHLCEEPTLFIK